MFMIPDFYREDFDFDFACNIVKGRANGDLLEGMKAIDRVWEDYLRVEREFNAGLRDDKVYGDDNDFYEHWVYEVNAYNVVFENMRKLFV